MILFVHFFLFLSILQMLKICVTVFSRTIQPTNWKLGTAVINKLLDHGIENRDAGFYSSLYLSVLSSFRLWKFVSVFLWIIHVRLFRFGAVMENELLFYGLVNQIAGSYSSIYLSFFSCSPVFVFRHWKLVSQISQETFKLKSSNWCSGGQSAVVFEGLESS